jgi:hypothetical protein
VALDQLTQTKTGCLLDEFRPHETRRRNAEEGSPLATGYALANMWRRLTWKTLDNALLIVSKRVDKSIDLQPLARKSVK